MGRVHLPELPASFCRFARENEKERDPCGVIQGPVYGPVRQHFGRFEIFRKNVAVLANQFVGYLVKKVGSLIHNALVGFGHNLLFLLPDFRPGCKRGATILEWQSPGDEKSVLALFELTAAC